MQIFVSYARQNLEFAQQLVEDLLDYQLTIWMDVRNIPHGANWDMEVQKGLDSSDLMIVLLSPASVASQNVADEWSYFLDKNKPILPLMIERCTVPFRLSRRQRVDFTTDYKAGFQELLRALGSPELVDPESTQRIRLPAQPSRSAPPAPAAAEQTVTAGRGAKGDQADASSTIAAGGPAPGLAARAPGAAAPVAPEVGVRMLPVIWADTYHWFHGMRGATEGDLMINNREMAFIPRARPIMTIPLQSVISAKAQRSVDRYLKLTYYGPGGVFKSMALMGAPKVRRNDINQEILHLLKLLTGRSLD